MFSLSKKEGNKQRDALPPFGEKSGKEEGKRRKGEECRERYKASFLTILLAANLSVTHCVTRAKPLW